MKIVINRCYGGFGLSEEALRRYAELKGLPFYVDRSTGHFPRYHTIPVEDANALYTNARDMEFSEDERTEFWDQYNAATLSDYDIARDDEALVQVVEELGDIASGTYAELGVVEIPDTIECWEITEYDGIESIVECHRSWF